MGKKIGIVILALAIIFGLWYWLYSDQWLQEFNQERSEDAALFRTQGLAEGQLTDQQGCQESALSNFAQCQESNFVCTVNQGVYLKACFETAAVTQGFCDNVPAFNEKATEDEKDWVKYNCWDMDIRGEGCRLLLRQRIQLCDALNMDVGLNRQN